MKLLSVQESMIVRQYFHLSLRNKFIHRFLVVVASLATDGILHIRQSRRGQQHASKKIHVAEAADVELCNRTF